MGRCATCGRFSAACLIRIDLTILPVWSLDPADSSRDELLIGLCGDCVLVLYRHDDLRATQTATYCPPDPFRPDPMEPAGESWRSMPPPETEHLRALADRAGRDGGSLR